MKSWPCVYECGNPVSDMGAYVKISLTKYAHLSCFGKVIGEQAVVRYRAEQALLRDAEQYSKQAAQDAAKAEAEKDLQRIYERGAANRQWTAQDRARLVAAKWICVHCGKRLSSGEGAGAEGKHCRACYMASQYGEQQAAQTAAKSAQGIAAVAEALKPKEAPKEAPKEEPKKEEEPKDRFNLIEME
jgi:hypothetical protein